MEVIKFLIKSTIYSTLIIGGGYYTMILVTPTKEQMQAEVDRYHKLKGKDQANTDKAVARLQMRAIMENAKSSRPAYDVRFPDKKDLEKTIAEGDVPEK